MKKLLLIALFLSAMPFAQAKDGSSGCGPAWYVLKDKSILSSALRATTNGILVPTVTLGMTFGTSNCTKHSIVKLEKERIKFTTENYFEIAADSSTGRGDFLMAYGELMGCGKENLQHFSGTMKSHFKKIFPSSKIQPKEVIKQTYIMMLQDENLSKACFQG